MKKKIAISILQRYKPIFRDGQNVLYQNGKRRDQFDGHSVPAQAYFGQLESGRRFIVVTNETKIGMVSYRCPEKWKNTFYPEIFNLLKRAGVFREQNLEKSMIDKSISHVQNQPCDTIKQGNLRSTQLQVSLFAKLILDTSFTDESFRLSDISLEIRNQIQNTANKLFDLECNYMKSEIESDQNRNERLQAINRWYSLLYDTDRESCDFNPKQKDLYMVDIAYLRSVYSRNGLESEFRNRFFHELIQSSTQVLKQQPLDTESGFYQLARRMHHKKSETSLIAKAKTCTERNPKDSAEFKASTQTLYVYKGIIKCLKNKHPLICVNAHVPTVSNVDVVLNVNFCKRCKRFYIEYDEYMHYLHKYKSLLTKIVLVNSDGFKLHAENFSEVSPLKLCGYSVAQNVGFSKQEREKILSEVIYKNIMKKQDVIQYLNWFIKMNGHKKENMVAKEKWESDLEFVRCLDMKHQQNYTISTIEAYSSKKIRVI